MKTKEQKSKQKRSKEDGVIILVEGGIVQAVYSENKVLDVEVIDIDVPTDSLEETQFKRDSAKEVSKTHHMVY